jgi:hypothetical protein
MPLGRPVPPALSSDAPTTWPLILPGEVSFRSTRPTLPPPAGELLQAIGQVLGPGHGRAVDEDRDDPSQSSHEAVINAPREAARIVSLMKTPPNTSMPSPLAQN